MNYDSMLRYIIGKIRIPDEVIFREEPIVLHITDTPKVIFKSIKDLVNIIHPEYIIHTGDLVDNLKLESYKGLEPLYEKAVSDIINIVKSSEIKGYIVLGNHDLQKVKTHETEKLVVFDKAQELNIEGVNIKLSHKYNSGYDGDFYLFGHDDTRPIASNELNGIHSIYVIFLKSKKVVRLGYPWGTQDQRLLKKSIGL